MQQVQEVQQQLHSLRHPALPVPEVINGIVVSVMNRFCNRCDYPIVIDIIFNVVCRFVSGVKLVERVAPQRAQVRKEWRS